MLAAQAASPGKFKDRIFYPAWALVFLIAASGTGLEIAVGNACPRNSSEVPLCYFSFALSIAIIFFYIFTANTRIIAQR
jgi:hypothetical protein